MNEKIPTTLVVQMTRVAVCSLSPEEELRAIVQQHAGTPLGVALEAELPKFLEIRRQLSAAGRQQAGTKPSVAAVAERAVPA